MTDYLFSTNPGILHLQTEVLTASFLILAICVLGVFLLKKRRGFIKINRDQRFALQKSFKINSILSAVLLLFVLFRISQVNFLSMRIFPILLCLAVAVVFIIGIVRAIKHKEFNEVATVVPDEYAKYLPKKKKK